MPSLITQQDIPSLYVQGIFHPRSSVIILWLMLLQQGVIAQKKKGKSKKKEICWTRVLGSLTVSLPCCCRTCRTTAPSLRGVQWLGTEEFWRTADVAGRLTVQTSCFGNHHGSIFLFLPFLMTNRVLQSYSLSHDMTFAKLAVSSLLLAQKAVFQKKN